MSSSAFLFRVSAFSLALVALAAAGCSKGSGDAPPDPDPQSLCEMTDRTLPIPFDYTVESDHLAVATDGGPIAVMIGPWGAHVPPHTGHAEGNLKADWFALWTPHRDSAGLVQVAWGTGDVTPGGCDMGARCGVLESDMLARIPWYSYPDDEVRLVRVELYAQLGSDPFDMHAFEVEVELCPYRITLGHVGQISDEVAELIVAAGGSDPRVAPVLGENALGDGVSVQIPAGTPIARPQIRSEVIADNTAYRTGRDSVPDVPWAQIEWSAIHMLESADGLARAEYAYMDADLQLDLADVLDTQASDPESFRYANSFTPKWLWTAEHVLVATEPFLRNGPATGLTYGVGGWFQRTNTDPCTPYSDPNCAETFSIFPLHPEGTYYNASYYDSPDVAYLVYRGRAAGDASDFVAFGELVLPVDPDPISGTLVVKWRQVGNTYYQAISYRFDPATLTTRFRYGDLVLYDPLLDPADVTAPTVPTNAEPCTADTLICMTQEGFGRF